MSKPTTIAAHFNSQNEKISIERVVAGDFRGQLLLVIHDDHPSTTIAPMLLDDGTRLFLIEQCRELDTGPFGESAT